MKKVLASVCGGAVFVVLLAGCDPHLAQIPSGTQEELWYKQLKSNYSSFTPPRNPAPAAYSPNYNTRQNSPGVPADDPEKAVDNAADGGKVTNLEDAAPQPQKDEKAEKKAVQEPAVVQADKKDPAVKDAAKSDGAAAQGSDAEGKIYIVKSGDTLGGIAKQFYGKASLEDVIFRANSKVLKNRNTLSIGMRLVIPEL